MSYNNLFAGLLSRLSEAMNRAGEQMKAKAYKKAEETILSFTSEIHSVADIKGKSGIGPAVTKKLQEYLDTGKIRVLEEEENKPEYVLTDIYGIGPKKAQELVKQGITTIDILRQRQNEVLNEVQKKRSTLLRRYFETYSASRNYRVFQSRQKVCSKRRLFRNRRKLSSRARNIR